MTVRFKPLVPLIVIVEVVTLPKSVTSMFIPKIKSHHFYLKTFGCSQLLQ